MIKKIIFFMLSLTCTSNHSAYESNAYGNIFINKLNKDFTTLRQIKKFKSKAHEKMNQETMRLYACVFSYLLIIGVDGYNNRITNQSDLISKSYKEFILNDEIVNAMKANLIKKLPSIILSNETIQLIETNKISKIEKEMLVKIVLLLIIIMRDERVIQTPNEIILHFEKVAKLLKIPNL